MTVKSDSDLKEIIASDSYVDEAKRAAAWELEKRNVEHEYLPPNLSRRRLASEASGPDNAKSGSKKYHENRLLVFGISSIISALYFLAPTVFTAERSLTPIVGVLNSVEIIVDNVSSKGRYGYEAKSRRASLYFSLNDTDKVFILRENIGQKYRHDEYLRIKRNLEISDSLKVWVRNYEIDNRYPKVFRIEADDRTILTLEDVKQEYSWVFILTIFLGTGLIVFVLKRKYPGQFRRIFREKAATDDSTHSRL